MTKGATRAGDLEAELVRAREQQAAVAAVMRTMSTAPTDLDATLDAILTAATRLCHAAQGYIYVLDGDVYRITRTVGIDQGFDAWAREHPIPVGDPGKATSRAAMLGKPLHIPDVLNDAEYTFKEAQERGNFRTILCVPLMKDGVAVAVISMWRTVPEPFTDEEIGLVSTFADQALIAFESVRLTKETRESLEQQQAIADVLAAIGRATSDVRPVFDTILEHAGRLCDADRATIALREAEAVVVKAGWNMPQAAMDDYTRQPYAVDRSTAVGRTILEGRTLTWDDMTLDAEISPRAQATRGISGARSVLTVPLLRDGIAIGAINLRRTEVRPFTRQEATLVETFAEQATLAIENVQLFNETKGSLERQTAVSTVLESINAAAFDLDRVLGTVIESAMRLCRADNGTILRLDPGGGAVQVARAGTFVGEEAVRSLTAVHVKPDRGTVTGRVLLERQSVQIVDAMRDPEYGEQWKSHDPDRKVSLLGVPLLRAGAIAGVIVLRRLRIEPFSEAEIRLVETFANQAVVAMENARLFNETKESLERQTAVGEILRVMSASPTDIQPVLDAIAASAARFCQAEDVVVMLEKIKDTIEPASHYGPLPVSRVTSPTPLDRGAVSGRAMLERRVVQVEDLMTADDFPLSKALSGEGRQRTVLAAPMIREGKAIGTILLRRGEVRAFSDRQIELAQTFADQAVIAIENVRLFNETKEALERQTAMAEVLKTMSRSAFDLEPVLDTVVENTARLAGGDVAWLARTIGDEGYRVLSRVGPAFERPEVAAVWSQLTTMRIPASGSLMGRLLRERRVIHIEDARAEPELWGASVLIRATEAKTVLAIPMLREGVLLGGVIVGRTAVRQFNEREIALVQTFADQAAIAIENVRLFNETKEALERQTALSEILQVISKSPTDTQPVFETIARNAARYCAAEDAVVQLVYGDRYRRVAHSGSLAELNVANDLPLTAATLTARVLREGRTLHEPDLPSSTEYPEGAEFARAMGVRCFLTAPLMRDDRAIGTISLRRREAQPFTEQQIQLLEAFAAQAVIAIENVRLFNETKDALERQTATSDVLQAISQARDEVRPVMQTIVDAALRLCSADSAGFFHRDGDQVILDATAGAWPEGERSIGSRREFASMGFVKFAFAERRTFNVPDMAAAEVWHLFRSENPVGPARNFPDAAAWAKNVTRNRSRLIVPVLRGDVAVGVIRIHREEPGGFTPRQVELVESFAAQAAIAIENVRLFNETQQSLERQTAVADVLKTISQTTFDLQAVFDVVVENATKLCRGDFGYLFRRDGDVFRFIASAGGEPELVEYERTHPTPISPRTLVGRVALGRALVHIPDLFADPEYDWPVNVAHNVHTITAVPIFSGGEVVGAIGAARYQVEPFSSEELRLLETFADQAGIAIENVRLFNETKEGLDRQTALADVLRAIAGSPTDVQPVLDTIAESAARFTGAEDVNIRLAENGELPVRSHWGPISLAGTERFEIDTESIASTSYLERRTVHVADILGPEGDQFPRSKERARATGHRAMLIAPLIREGQPIGVIAARKSQPVAFTSEQVKLVETFADQAVIAIENVRLFNETKESLEQQTAIADILRVISASPTDTQPVLEAIAASATKFAAAEDASVLLVRDGALLPVAHHGPIPMPLSVPLDRDSVSGRAVLETRTIHAADVTADDEYPQSKRAGVQDGQRTVLAAPLIQAGKALGVIVLRRREPRPFSDGQVELVQTFANQAAIALENVRLFNQTTESLERQTAIAEVLGAMSASPTDVEPVLETISRSAARICGATYAGVMLLVDDDHLVAHQVIRPGGGPPTTGRPFAVEGSISGRAIREQRTISVADVLATDEYPTTRESAARMRDSSRSMLAVPLIRQGKAIGTIFLRRAEVRPFAPNQIDIVRTFADQAVIAIENVRLFNETKEALAQQTATAEVLGTISRSAFDLGPVLQTVIESAVRLTAADNGSIVREERGQWAQVAIAGRFVDRAAYEAIVKGVPIERSRNRLTGRVLLERRTVQIPDINTDPEWEERSPGQSAASGSRALLGVPLMREDEVIGVVILRRSTPGPFSEAQVKVVETFAAQAAIAIENVRLFNETTESLERQTAISDVLKTISRTVFDLVPTLQAVVDNAARLVDADLAWMSVRSGRIEEFTGRSVDIPSTTFVRYGRTPELSALFTQGPGPARTIQQRSIMARVYDERRTVHVPDSQLEPELTESSPTIKRTGTRTALAVPVISEGEVIAGVIVARLSVRPFNEREIQLVETFADQAGIAVQNVRLFNDIQEKSRELEVANRHKSEFLANMSHELRTPLNAIIGFSEVLLQGIFGDVNDKQREYLDDVLSSGKHLLLLINDILDLSKIEAGRMELEVSTFALAPALDSALTIVRERASRHGITLQAVLPKDLPPIEADERKVKQILFNLLSNAVKFTPDGGRVEIRARREDSEVRVDVQDTGIGIAPEDHARVFEEFQQVGRERSREGTGLGLTLSKRFVALHGGRIWVESAPGTGSTFSFTLPIRRPVEVKA